LNYNLTFDIFETQYTNGAWNTSELGGVIAHFVETGGTEDTAWVVAYPHWVDNRLVGINAGYPDKNYAIAPDEIVNTLDIPGPKLFLYRPDDTDAAQILEDLYPNGANALHDSPLENKDFYTFFVPAEK
jgi:hypothetical protein